jgi:hypothetical protein
MFFQRMGDKAQALCGTYEDDIAEPAAGAHFDTVRNWQKPLHVNSDAIRIANNALFLLGETVDSLGFLQEAKRSAVFHV